MLPKKLKIAKFSKIFVLVLSKFSGLTFNSAHPISLMTFSYVQIYIHLSNSVTTLISGLSHHSFFYDMTTLIFEFKLLKLQRASLKLLLTAKNIFKNKAKMAAACRLN
jgi:hypothetical protein